MVKLSCSMIVKHLRLWYSPPYLRTQSSTASFASFIVGVSPNAKCTANQGVQLIDMRIFYENPQTTANRWSVEANQGYRFHITWINTSMEAQFFMLQCIIKALVRHLSSHSLNIFLCRSSKWVAVAQLVRPTNRNAYLTCLRGGKSHSKAYRSTSQAAVNTTSALWILLLPCFSQGGQ